MSTTLAIPTTAAGPNGAASGAGWQSPPPVEIAPALERTIASCNPAMIGGKDARDPIAAAIDACRSETRVHVRCGGRGLLRGAESLFRAARLELPIVLTVAVDGDSVDSEKLSAAMAIRDFGWVQLFPSSLQDAVDAHVQAFRIAERLSLPVMVCLDRFSPVGAVSVPTEDEVRLFLERPTRTADRDRRAAAHVIAAVSTHFREHFGRASGGLLISRHMWGARAVVLGLGSMFSALSEAVDELRPRGVDVGALALECFRPFPGNELAHRLAQSEHVIVVEPSAIGGGEIISSDLRCALGPRSAQIHTLLTDSGGRSVGQSALCAAARDALNGRLRDRAFGDGQALAPRRGR
jgi:pyruvate ferredoxin oxidoreductase alpha subunit